MAQIILDSSNNLIQGDFDNATINNRTKFKTTTTNATTNVYAVPNGSATSAGFTVTNAADPTNASKLTIATNGSTDTQIISGVNGSGTYLPMSFYTNNTLAMQIGTNGQITVAATANPTFRASKNSNQAISTSTWTKIQFNVEDWDTNSNYDNTTNYRFTPTVAGYYQVDLSVEFNNVAGSYIVAIYKNGTDYTVAPYYAGSSGGSAPQSHALIYMNGSTDYLEGYGYTTVASQSFYSGDATYFNASLARSA